MCGLGHNLKCNTVDFGEKSLQASALKSELQKRGLCFVLEQCLAFVSILQMSEMSNTVLPSRRLESEIQEKVNNIGLIVFIITLLYNNI